MVVPAVDVCLYIYPMGESKVQKTKLNLKKTRKRVKKDDGEQ